MTLLQGCKKKKKQKERSNLHMFSVEVTSGDVDFKITSWPHMLASKS